jgi:DNA repair exonuclease SbcCD nuclease subunit
MRSKELVFELLLIGDSGNIKRNQPDEAMELMRNHLPEQPESCVVFLGDNVYPQGLPDENHSLRKDAEAVLNKHHEALDGYKGKVIFISGNHDWNKGKADGIEYVLRQEKYIHQLFHQQALFIPEWGCPGPTLVDLNEQVCIIAINTQWWVQKGFRPIGKSNNCNVESEAQFFEKLRATLEENKHKRIVVIGHYPVYSYSLHGGRYKLRHHLFPLTIYKRRALVPMPLVGSLLPLYRKYFGAREDLSHPRFKLLRQKLKNIFKNYPGLIYAAGHEHNLQHIEKYNNHFIVSGAASKATYVIDGKYSKFGVSAKGFFKLKFYANKKVKTEVLVTDSYNAMGKLVYESWIV